MNDLAKQLAINAGNVGRYLSKARLANMTSRYFNGAMIGVSLCFFVSPNNQRGEWVVFLLATMGYATCIWLSDRWQRQADTLKAECAALVEKMMERMEDNNAESN